MVCTTIVFVHATDVKFGPPSENFSPLGVPSWLRVCWWLLPCEFCQLCHSAQSFHNQIFRFVEHQILIGEIKVKSFILDLYTHNDTKIYFRLNRNQNEQRW